MSIKAEHKVILDKIVRLCQQEPCFKEELLRRFVHNPLLLSDNDQRMDEIYEYCIERIIKQQAQEFYRGFPFGIAELTSDFCRMETFRRKGNFVDFCMATYQQIEFVVNNICRDPQLDVAIKRMWGLSSVVNGGKGPVLISNRCEKKKDGTKQKTIAELLLYRDRNGEIKIPDSIMDLIAICKTRVVVYFVGYKASLTQYNVNLYYVVDSCLRDLYQCRNLNHRGGLLSEKQEQILKREGSYCYKFMWALGQFMDMIRANYASINELIKYSETIK